MRKNPRIVLIGGGTGSFTLLQKLKDLTPNITAIVSMGDDGGSTGQLRDEFGVLPPGDVRQCLIALSDAPELRDVLSYRFGGEGPLAGHSLGNLLLSGLELQQGNFNDALKIASSILRITGRVIPVTLEKHALVLEDDDTRLVGQSQIDNHHINKSARLSLEPACELNPDAGKAIKAADVVIIAPGSLYSSLLAALVVDGVDEALAATKAKKIMIANLVNKPGQTDDWHVVDYVKAIEKYVGKGQIDVVLYNRDLPPQELLQKYADDGEFPVKIGAGRFNEISAQAIGANLVAKDIVRQDPNDKAIKRTLIRHDAEQVGQELVQILEQ